MSVWNSNQWRTVSILADWWLWLGARWSDRSSDEISRKRLGISTVNCDDSSQVPTCMVEWTDWDQPACLSGVLVMISFVSRPLAQDGSCTSEEWRGSQCRSCYLKCALLAVEWTHKKDKGELVILFQLLKLFQSRKDHIFTGLFDFTCKKDFIQDGVNLT